MAKGIKRQVKQACEAVQKEISGHAESGGLYARGLASEGWNGGYAAALEDVKLALNGVEPNRWREWRQRHDST